MYDLIKYDKHNGQLRFLNILATDATEQDLYDFRFDANIHEHMWFYTPERLQDFHKSISIKTSEDIVNKERFKRREIRKIGFISRDFSQGRPSGQLAEHFFDQLHQYAKKTGLEVFFYTFPRSTTPCFRNFATVREGRTVHKLAEIIYEDKLDILIDMQGHMHNNFNITLIKKPAPIIMHWLGYPGTTGIREVDYIFADETILPRSSQQYYREKIIYLPNCYQINNPRLLVTDETCWYKRSDYEYPEDGILFAHFNDSYKLDKNTWMIWCDILKRVPNSYLVFLKKYQKETEQIINDAVEFGVKREQLIITKRLNRMHHIHRLNLLNIGLDTYYCNGHTTSSDLIAAGRPVITFPRSTYHGRVTLSILRSLDLEELAVSSWQEYIDSAVKLATDKEYYQSVCRKIVQNREKTLYNPELYFENWINAVNETWHNHDFTVKSLNIQKVDVEEKD